MSEPAIFNALSEYFDVEFIDEGVKSACGDYILTPIGLMRIVEGGLTKIVDTNIPVDKPSFTSLFFPITDKSKLVIMEQGNGYRQNVFYDVDTTNPDDVKLTPNYNYSSVLEYNTSVLHYVGSESFSSKTTLRHGSCVVFSTPKKGDEHVELPTFEFSRTSTQSSSKWTDDAYKILKRTDVFEKTLTVGSNKYKFTCFDNYFMITLNRHVILSVPIDYARFVGNPSELNNHLHTNASQFPCDIILSGTLYRLSVKHQ